MEKLAEFGSVGNGHSILIYLERHRITNKSRISSQGRRLWVCHLPTPSDFESRKMVDFKSVLITLEKQHLPPPLPLQIMRRSISSVYTPGYPGVILFEVPTAGPHGRVNCPPAGHMAV